MTSKCGNNKKVASGRLKPKSASCTMCSSCGVDSWEFGRSCVPGDLSASRCIGPAWEGWVAGTSFCVATWTAGAQMHRQVGHVTLASQFRSLHNLRQQSWCIMCPHSKSSRISPSSNSRVHTAHAIAGENVQLRSGAKVQIRSSYCHVVAYLLMDIETCFDSWTTMSPCL